MINYKVRVYRAFVIVLAAVVVAAFVIFQLTQLITNGIAHLSGATSKANSEIASTEAGVAAPVTAHTAQSTIGAQGATTTQGTGNSPGGWLGGGADGAFAGYLGLADAAAGSIVDADRFFEVKMARSGANAAVPNGIYSKEGLSLMAAAGAGAGYENILEDVQSAYGTDGSNGPSGSNGSSGAGDAVDAGDAGAAVDAGDAGAAGDGSLSLPQQLAARAALYPNSPLSAVNTAATIDAPFNHLQLSSYASPLAGAMLYANMLLEDNRDAIDSLVAHADRPRRPIYLTIDDGPSSLTGQFLDILREKGVRATFFVVGANARRHPDVIREMYEGGHCIANHSYTHDYNRLYQSSSSLRSELTRCDNVINDILGFQYTSGIFRFPGGSSYKTATQYKSAVRNMGYRYYDWNCLNGDAQIRDKSADSLYNYMLSTYKDQYEVILLMHDSDTKQTTVDMLGRAIDFFIENDYEFFTLDEK
ncbi:MAG: polysaccharide deacetylase [Oscillospiraceae bacterium]|nr:polysaccharide deacetylase [Oscillospiraceae bacterium]